MGRKSSWAAGLIVVATFSALLTGCQKASEPTPPPAATPPVNAIPVNPPAAETPPAPAAPTSTSPAPEPTSPPAAPSAEAAPVERNLAAHVNLVDGSAELVGPDKSVRAIQQGDPVREGDSIVTGADAEVHLDMADGGFVAVRPNTAINIAQFQANGDENDRSVIGLVKGGLRSITGWIGHTYPANYSIVTPSATIGVRGTDHEPTYVPESTGETQAGTYDHVYEGQSKIVTPQGTIDVEKGHAGFVDHTGHGTPRTLARVPRIFEAPHQHDAVFVGKHAQVMSTLETRRQARIVEHAREPVRPMPASSRALPGSTESRAPIPIKHPDVGANHAPIHLEGARPQARESNLGNLPGHTPANGAQGKVEPHPPLHETSHPEVRPEAHPEGRPEGRPEAHPEARPGTPGASVKGPFAPPGAAGGRPLFPTPASPTGANSRPEVPGARPETQANPLPGNERVPFPNRYPQTQQTNPNVRPNPLNRLFPNLQRPNPGNPAATPAAPGATTPPQNGTRPATPTAQPNPFFPRAQTPQPQNQNVQRPVPQQPAQQQRPPARPEPKKKPENQTTTQ